MLIERLIDRTMINMDDSVIKLENAISAQFDSEIDSE